MISINHITEDDQSYSTASQSCPPSQLSVFRDESIGSFREYSNREASYSTALTLHSPGTKARKKADIARAQRTIERLDQAELQLKMKGSEMTTVKYRGRHRHKLIRQRAETQLRLSQIDVARKFYQRRIAKNSVTGPVPMEILKIVKSVSAPNLQRPRAIELV
jgi:hypothetical protein